MPRIRTVKPEFWEDEVLGLLPRDARLLFVATFNMADDEGLLRWTPAYVKASAFMYDDDLTVNDVGKLMQHITDAGLLFPYVGGVARQQLACIVNFRKHQRINRPQKSKLVPPSLQSGEVRRMYGRRDRWTCQLCGSGIPEMSVANDSHNLSIDHIKPQSAGGTDHPSNVRATHQACNKSRRNSPEGDEFTPPRSLADLNDSLTDSVNRSVNGSGPTPPAEHAAYTATPSQSTERDIYSLNDSVNSSVNDSPPEGKGREGNREGKGTPQPPSGNHSGSPAVAQTGERAIEDRMTDAFLDRYKAGNAYGQRQVRKVITDTLANGTQPEELWRALERIGQCSKPVSPGTLQFAFAELRKQAQTSNVIALPGGQQLTGTDAKVAGWAAIAASFNDEDSA